MQQQCQQESSKGRISSLPACTQHGAHQHRLPMRMTLARAPSQQVPASLLSSPDFTNPQPSCRAALMSGPALGSQGTGKAHVRWPEQVTGSLSCQPHLKEIVWQAGSPLPGISLSVPDCDQETFLLMLLLQQAVTSRGTACEHQPSPGVLSKGCPHTRGPLTLLRARSSSPFSAQSTAASPQTVTSSNEPLLH